MTACGSVQETPPTRPARYVAALHRCGVFAEPTVIGEIRGNFQGLMVPYFCLFITLFPAGPFHVMEIGDNHFEDRASLMHRAMPVSDGPSLMAVRHVLAVRLQDLGSG